MRLRHSNLGIARILGINLLISSLIHVPLPQPDFHNVRHHDSPGEVCTYHDHLLRWHPAASLNADATILHWHWVLPILEESGEDPGCDDRQHHHPGRSGPSFHAHVGDGLEPDWSNAQWLSSEGAAGTLESVATPLAISIFGSHQSLTFEAHPPAQPLDRSMALPHAHSALRLILQRWNC